MAVVASEQQMTALFLSTIVTRTRRHTELTKKTDKPDGEACALPDNNQFSFFVQFFTQFKLECMGPFTLPQPVKTFPRVHYRVHRVRHLSLS